MLRCGCVAVTFIFFNLLKASAVYTTSHLELTWTLNFIKFCLIATFTWIYLILLWIPSKTLVNSDEYLVTELVSTGSKLCPTLLSIAKYGEITTQCHFTGTGAEQHRNRKWIQFEHAQYCSLCLLHIYIWRHLEKPGLFRSKKWFTRSAYSKLFIFRNSF